jgi:tryptophan 2,3-dioxygenase
MRAVGHVEITGTLGSDCAYIQVFPTPTGRKIVFVTNRQIRMAEAWTDSQSQSFDLTAGILELDDQDKSKSTGVVFPAAQLVVNKDGKLEWDLRQNAWKLVDVLDWKGTAGLN